MNIVEEGTTRPGPGRTAAAEVTPEVPAAVTWSAEGAVLSVVLTGAVDASLYPRFELLSAAFRTRFERTDLDLEKVTFFGAAGLNLLVRLASSSATVTLLGIPERLPIRWAIRAVGLDSLIAYPSAGVAGWSEESAA